MPPRNNPPARRMGIIPILHVVLLGHSRRTGVADVIIAEEILHRARRVAIDEEKPPNLGLVRADRMPHRQRARLPGQQCHIGKNLARCTNQPAVGTRPAAPLLLAMAEIFRDLRGVLICRLRLIIPRQSIGNGLMPAIGNRYMQLTRHIQLPIIPSALAARSRTDQIDRPVGDIVIRVAAEIFRRPFPVAWDNPFLHPAQQFRLAFAPIPAVQNQIEESVELPQILVKRRCRGIPIGPNRAFVVAQLRDLDQPVLRSVQLGVIRLPEERHTCQSTIGAKAPAVIGAGENRRIPVIVAAHFHAAMPA